MDLRFLPTSVGVYTRTNQGHNADIEVAEDLGGRGRAKRTVEQVASSVIGVYNLEKDHLHAFETYYL